MMQHAIFVTASNRYRYGLYAIAALMALLQPLMTPWAPAFAGWLPGHQHVFVNGMPIAHSHPWDDEQPSGESTTSLPSGVPAGYVFHLCDIHPDGLVPIGDPSSGTTATERERGTDASQESEEVVFLFDLGVSSVFLPVPTGAPPSFQGELIATDEITYTPGHSFASHPTPPPPRL